jgi:hypothetical protein
LFSDVKYEFYRRRSKVVASKSESSLQQQSRSVFA